MNPVLKLLKSDNLVLGFKGHLGGIMLKIIEGYMRGSITDRIFNMFNDDICSNYGEEYKIEDLVRFHNEWGDGCNFKINNVEYEYDGWLLNDETGNHIFKFEF